MVLSNFIATLFFLGIGGGLSSAILMNVRINRNVDVMSKWELWTRRLSILAVVTAIALIILANIMGWQRSC